MIPKYSTLEQCRPIPNATSQIRAERRSEYLAALEKASIKGEVADFTKFVAGEMKASAMLKPFRRQAGSIT